MVHYPLEDLIKLVALESVRNQCVVIGEDLGVVPDVVREILTRFKCSDTRCRSLKKRTENSLRLRIIHAMHWRPSPRMICHCSRHGWNNDDIKLSESLHHYPNKETQERVQRERDVDRQQLMHALVHTGLCTGNRMKPYLNTRMH